MTALFYVVSYCHLSATLQTISIIVVKLQDNRALFRIFIALLRFPFDSPSYFIAVTEHFTIHILSYCAMWNRKIRGSWYHSSKISAKNL